MKCTGSHIMDLAFRTIIPASLMLRSGVVGAMHAGAAQANCTDLPGHADLRYESQIGSRTQELLEPLVNFQRDRKVRNGLSWRSVRRLSNMKHRARKDRLPARHAAPERGRPRIPHGDRAWRRVMTSFRLCLALLSLTALAVCSPAAEPTPAQITIIEPGD